MPQKRILAVGHDAYRAGAQIVFLHLLRWLRQHHDADISLTLIAGGDLVDDYSDVLPTSLLPSRLVPTSRFKVIGAAKRAGHRIRTRNDHLRPGSVDLVYANSAASARTAVELAAEAGCPSVCHVHELEMSIRRFAGEFRDAAPHIDRFIAVSRAVERNLVENHGVDPRRIDLVHPAVPLPPRQDAADRSRLVRAELGIEPDAFVV